MLAFQGSQLSGSGTEDRVAHRDSCSKSELSARDNSGKPNLAIDRCFICVSFCSSRNSFVEKG